MKDAESYWGPVCQLVSRLRCWVRVSYAEGSASYEGWWGQLLTMPVKGYLEAAGGPTPLRDIDWVEVALSRVKGGIAGRPLEIIDRKDEILAAFNEIQMNGELRKTTWSLPGIFEDEPVQVVRFMNPFRSMQSP
jgi:hypothetical protein